MWILWQEIFSSIYVANVHIIYLSVRSSSRRAREGVNERDRYLATSSTVLEYMIIWCKIQVIIKSIQQYIISRPEGCLNNAALNWKKLTNLSKSSGLPLCNNFCNCLESSSLNSACLRKEEYLLFLFPMISIII